MSCGHLDGPPRFRVEPAVSMTKAVPADWTNLAVNDRKFELAAKRGRLNAAPSRGIEKSGKRCRKSLHGDQSLEQLSSHLRRRQPARLDPAQRLQNPYFYGQLRFST